VVFQPALKQAFIAPGMCTAFFSIIFPIKGLSSPNKNLISFNLSTSLYRKVFNSEKFFSGYRSFTK